jgi:hypothetical protein
VLVNTGARFTPCIRDVPSFPVTEIVHFCYQNATSTCTLEELCGFDGFGPSGIPNQSFRLVIPIFMHAGVVHFLMNMLTHLRLGVDLERALGTPRYFVLYMASGIGGFIVSAMLSQNLSGTTKKKKKTERGNGVFFLFTFFFFFNSVDGMFRSVIWIDRLHVY